MTNLEIKINIRKLRNDRKVQKYKDEKSFTLLVEHFAKYIARLYVDLIEKAIESHQYKGKWEPVDDEEYIKYLGTEPKKNIIVLIKEAMEVKKVGYNFIVRINPYYRYPDSDLTLLQVLRAIDNGTSKFPARPIFNKIVRSLNNQLLRLWRGYLTKKGVI